MIDAATRELLLANGRDRERDHPPVIKLFNPAGPATWLICAMEADGDILFGLCDLGFGEPELGYVSLEELREVSSGSSSVWSAMFRSEPPIRFPYIHGQQRRRAGLLSSAKNRLWRLARDQMAFGGLLRPPLQGDNQDEAIRGLI